MKFKALALHGILATFSIACGAAHADAEGLADIQRGFKYCLAFRLTDQECVRKSRNDNWTCAERPRLVAPTIKCVSWAQEARNECVSIFGQGLFWQDTNVDVALNGKAKLGFLRCTPSSVKPEPETVPELPLAFSKAAHFDLPREKFPQCIAVRIRTHECTRGTVADAWSCSHATPLRQPTAICLITEHQVDTTTPGPAKDIDIKAWLGVCRDLHDWAISRFVTANVNPYSHDKEPVLRCDEIPSPTSNIVHTLK